MPIDFNTVLEACELVAKDENLKVCVEESTKGAFIAGGSALVGGLLLGPVGIAAGGALGGLLGMKASKNFKPLHAIITEMKPEDQQKLSAHMLIVINRLNITDGAILLALLNNSSSVEHEAFLEGLTSYFGKNAISH